MAVRFFSLNICKIYNFTYMAKAIKEPVRLDKKILIAENNERNIKKNVKSKLLRDFPLNTKKELDYYC